MTQDALEKKRGIPDIVFLIDSSGSMAPCIDALRANIGAFIDTLTSPDANGGILIKDWRIRVIGYRDRDADGQQWLIDNPFVADVAAAKSQLATLQAAGGGDEPESLLDALYLLTQWPSAEPGQAGDPTGWRHRHDARRVAVVFTDASCKSTFTAADGATGTFDDIINACNAARIKMCLFAPDTPGYLQLEQMDGCEYDSYGPLETAVKTLATLSAETGRFQKVMEQLAKSISTASSENPL